MLLSQFMVSSAMHSVPNSVPQYHCYPNWSNWFSREQLPTIALPAESSPTNAKIVPILVLPTSKPCLRISFCRFERLLHIHCKGDWDHLVRLAPPNDQLPSVATADGIQIAFVRRAPPLARAWQRPNAFKFTNSLSNCVRTKPRCS